MLRSLFGLIFLLLLTAVTHPLAAQRKTRFMKQLEKAEAEKAAREAKEMPYKVATARADSLFRLKQYQPAIDQYRVALNDRPGDAFSLAKITDLRIILKQKSNPELSREEAKTIVLQEMAEEGIQPLPQARPTTPPTPMVPERKAPPVLKAAPAEENEIASPKVEQPKQPAIPKVVAPQPPEETPKEIVTAVEKETPPKVAPKPAPKRKAQAVSEVETRPLPKPAPPKKDPEPVVQEDGTPYPQGMTEEVIEEERSVTVKRVVQEGVRTDVYRKVTHAWGGIFFFKNDVSITERVWKEETGKD